MERSVAEKRTFLKESWLPYLKRLRRALISTAEKVVQGWSASESAPSQEQLEKWAVECFELSRQWHGRPNLSAFYEFFIELTNVMGIYSFFQKTTSNKSILFNSFSSSSSHFLLSFSGINAFTMDKIPTRWSDDGYLWIIDSRVRASFYTTGGTDSGKTDDSAEEWFSKVEVEEARNTILPGLRVTAEGLLSQEAGESAIDNTVLPNVLSTCDCKLLLVGAVAKRFILKMLAFRQTRWLRLLQPHRALLFSLLSSQDLSLSNTLSNALASSSSSNADDWLLTASPSYVRRLLAAVLRREGGVGVLRSIGVAADSMSFRLTVALGMPLSSWAQLPGVVAQVWHTRMSLWILDRTSLRSRSYVNNDSDRLQEFLRFLNESPGRWFHGSKSLHRQLLLVGILANRFSLVSRSTIEAHTDLRYFRFRWHRQLPLILVTLPGDDTEEEGEGVVVGEGDGGDDEEDDDKKKRSKNGGMLEKVIRKAGQEETARVRSNRFPYQASHGISLSSSGLCEERESPLFEAGAALPVDGEAKVGNWHCTDIEKILVEAELFNPRRFVDEHGVASPKFQALPGECFHDAGQNPRHASSIGRTHHTHLSWSRLEDWPAYSRLRNSEAWVDELGAFLDLVQIGREYDSCFVRLRTMRPTSLPVLRLLHGLRLRLLRALGPRAVDFNVYAGCADDGWFVIVFCPIAQQPLPTLSPGPTLLPTPVTMGFSNGKGAIGVSSTAALQYCRSNGFSVLTRLYDACRLIGARAVVRDYLLDRVAYIDQPGQISHPAVLNTHDSTADALRNRVFGGILPPSAICKLLDI